MMQTQLVKKTAIIDSGDFNLSATRYLENVEISSDYPLVRLGDIASFQNGFAFKKSDWVNTGKPIIRIQNLTNTGKYFNRTNRNVDKKYNVENGDLLISWSATIGVFIWNGESALLNQHIFLVKPNDMILKKYFYFLGNNIKNMIQNFVHGNTMTHITKSKFLDIKIPLPPLEIQEQLVKELEGYQQIIDGCRQVVENYKPVIDIDPSWNMVKISDIAEINPKKTEICNNDLKKTASFVPMKDLNEFNIYFNAVDSMNVEAMYSKGYSYFKDSDVLLAKVTPCFENGKSGIAKNLLNGFGFGSTEFYVFRANENTFDKWIYYNIVTNKFINDGINNFTGTSGLRRVPKDFVSNYQIPLPDIQTQKVIVEKLEQERNVVDGNKELIKIYEDKINARINKVWSDN